MPIRFNFVDMLDILDFTIVLLLYYHNIMALLDLYMLDIIDCIIDLFLVKVLAML